MFCSTDFPAVSWTAGTAAALKQTKLSGLVVRFPGIWLPSASYVLRAIDGLLGDQTLCGPRRSWAVSETDSLAAVGFAEV
jgi:hypothetical protein